jgi:hypothetical protein
LTSIAYFSPSSIRTPGWSRSRPNITEPVMLQVGNQIGRYTHKIKDVRLTKDCSSERFLLVQVLSFHQMCE